MIFLQYPVTIRKVIYTTNAIESLNNQLRKVTKISVYSQMGLSRNRKKSYNKSSRYDIMSIF